ncbi:BnaAnng18750D [Brassica napus]|uniref:BnaAnng18750D protein n=2 Tax=Brassica napus TaxID=3708 RepID=A0A078JB84_BRANA|nr:BnaAnng18750D [Brassica napus]
MLFSVLMMFAFGILRLVSTLSFSMLMIIITGSDKEGIISTKAFLKSSLDIKDLIFLRLSSSLQRKIHIEQLLDSSLMVRLVESLIKSPTLNLVVCLIVEKLAVCSIVEHLVVVPIVELAGLHPTAEH